MIKRFLMTVALAAALAAPAWGQEEQAAKPEQTKPSAQTPAAEARHVEPRGPLANIRLELTLTDQRGSGTPSVKTVSMMTANGYPGRIRSTGDVRTPQGYRNVILNVDSDATIVGDKVRARVALEYKPIAVEGTTEDQAAQVLSESFTVLLENDKPLVITQSADAHSDRRVKVELKATILK